MLCNVNIQSAMLCNVNIQSAMLCNVNIQSAMLCNANIKTAMLRYCVTLIYKLQCLRYSHTFAYDNNPKVTNNKCTMIQLKYTLTFTVL